MKGAPAVRQASSANSPVILMAAVGAAAGSLAAAAALAAAASEPDRAALLVELSDGRRPQPGLIATAAARRLEERLAAHLSEAGVASRGPLCRLQLPADVGGVERLPAALPLARNSAAVVHLPPALLQPVLDQPGIGPTGLLLRADLAADRALTALAVREPLERGLRVAVLKQPLGWLAARRALLGALPAGAAVLPPRLQARLIAADKNFLNRYHGGDGKEHGQKADLSARGGS